MTNACQEVTARPVAETKPAARPVYEPATDVIEKPDALHLMIDMPGVDQKGLDIVVEEHVLRIRGKSALTETRNEAALAREFEPADYERSFRLTNDVDETKITAAVKNGMLRVILPKAAKAMPRQIVVQTN